MTTPASNPTSEDFRGVLNLVASAVAAGVSLIQLREKNLSGHALFQLTVRAARIAHGSRTRLLVNDRMDIALAAGADGVHLTARSLPIDVVRRACGPNFLIGASTHTLAEALAARDGGANFAVFGPIFETPSKIAYGPPRGLEQLSRVAAKLAPFPLIALGGINVENAAAAIRAGAAGVAAIRAFDNSDKIRSMLDALGHERGDD